jgi:hypothetical protein
MLTTFETAANADDVTEPAAAPTRYLLLYIIHFSPLNRA